jgi:tetratricopeptide (TPR) repeat protein
MLDLRQTVPGLTRAAYLRELFGDVEGAQELMRMALVQTPDTETEDRAWLLTQIAHLELLQNDAAAAERALDEALATFANYHYALAGLAKVRMHQGRAGEAAELLRARYDAAPHPENLFDLAVALERAGRTAEARAAFARFEATARQEADKADNANHELVLYLADHANRPEEAFRIARLELSRRRDVHTRDVYAWALFKMGRSGEARRQMTQVLAVGVEDPRVLGHARAMGLTRQRSANSQTVARNGQ